MALALPALVHVLLLAAAFLLCGIGATPDSTYYVSAALNLKAGLGFSSSILLWDAPAEVLPLAAWPPLYPLLLAAVPGTDWEAAARWLNLAFIGANTWLLAWIVSRQGRGRALALLAGAAMVCSPAVFQAHGSVFSEPPFLLLVLAGLFCQERALLTGKLSWLLAGAGAVAGACLVRYIGISAVASGALAFALWGKGTRGRRAFSAALYAAASSLPLALWLIRNWLLTGTLTGHRGVVCVYTWTKALWDAAASFSCWFLPSFLPAVWAVALFTVLALSALAGLARLWLEEGLAEEGAHGGPYLAFIPAYLALTAAIFLTIQVDWLHSRYLVPVFPPFLVLAASAASRRRPGRGLAAAAALAFFAFPALNLARDIAYLKLRTRGVGYGSEAWRGADIIQAAKSGEPPFDRAGKVYTNTADVLLYYSGKPCRYLPERQGNVGEILESLRAAAGPDGLLVFVHRRDSRSNLIGEEAVSASPLFSLKKRFAAGNVYAPVQRHGS